MGKLHKIGIWHVNQLQTLLALVEQKKEEEAKEKSLIATQFQQHSLFVRLSLILCSFIIILDFLLAR